MGKIADEKGRSPDSESATPVPKRRKGCLSRMVGGIKCLICFVALLIVLALVLGIGLGIGLKRARKEGDVQQILTAPSRSRNIWQPGINTTWQIVLSKRLVLDTAATRVEPDVEVFDIDLFDNERGTIDTLHRLGKKVICYFSAGSYEPNRPDSKEFRENDLGRQLAGWPDERWLDLNSINVRRIMDKRMDLAKEKGCDAVDPDNMDGYDNKNGASLTKAITVDFLDFLTKKAQDLELGIGLKNAGAIVKNVMPAMQFSVNEQCVQFSDCDSFRPFINFGKPVFHIEYPDQVKSSFVQNLCKDSGPAKGSLGFSTVLKNYNLDGFVKFCNGTDTSTPSENPRV